MCFGSKLKGDDPAEPLDNYNARPVVAKYQRNSRSNMPNNQDYAPPSGPPPSHQAPEIYAAPSGPPPGHNEYSPPSGPPPNRSEYSAPSGPPPGQSDNTAPPPGPPPIKQEPYHDWQTAVPDTSLLPPPPSFFGGNQRSETNNATEQQAEQGEAWCNANPMTGPITLPEAALEALAKGEIGVIKPRDYKGELDRLRPGVWSGKTKASSPDTSIMSTLPLYSVLANSPLRTGRNNTIYYELRISKRNRRQVSLAIGYGAKPYPSFRLPGWHRGCLAVHGDDGSKYINDRWGGKNFTSPFAPGETIGIGMSFSLRDSNGLLTYDELPAQTTANTPINVEVFLTRNGRKDGNWNLHEESDAVEDLPVTGLEGLNDLYALVGTFENVEFDIVFNHEEFMYQP